MKDYTTHYMGMSKNMREVYAIPLVDLQNLMGQNTDFSRVLFVFKVGRCGSTLMTNLLDKAVGLCESHSEPFIFTQLLLLLSNKELEENKCSQFLRASVWVFVQGAQKRLSTKNPLVVLSPQGIGTYIYFYKHTKCVLEKLMIMEQYVMTNLIWYNNFYNVVAFLKQNDLLLGNSLCFD
eukprot:TRINITY_DN19794_c0_g1_i7.p1 TRINITY_DN19794_c0_g1~~TRINITY_DN19794_c0_g1_i7.p1  ORF type:complete len:179 (-),score=5.99 TRINITY_DN19794_c0_g1_i7:123-659(-)